jgi:transposase
MNPQKKSRKAVWWLSGLAGGAVLLAGLATLGTAAPTTDFSSAQNTAAAVNALAPVAAPVAAPTAEPQQETKTAIDKGLAGPGLLADIVTSKFAEYLPLYRLEDAFARQGFEISRATQSVWCGRICGAVLG